MEPPETNDEKLIDFAKFLDLEGRKVRCARRAPRRCLRFTCSLAGSPPEQFYPTLS